MINGSGQHIGPENHAGTTASGAIVHRPVLADTVLTNIVNLKRPNVFEECVARKRKSECSGKHVRKKRQYINLKLCH